MKKQIYLMALVTVFIGCTTRVQATDLQVQFSGASGSSPIFSLQNMKPGETESRVITVKNSTGAPKQIGLRVLDLHATSKIESIIKVTLTHGTTEILNETLAELSKMSQSIPGILLPTVLPFETRTFIISLEFPADSGNEYQDAKADFTISVGTVEPIPIECGRIEFPNPPIHGTDTSEIMRGTQGNDLIFAAGGNDRINGGGGDDCILGGSGNDIIYGNDGQDRLYGGDGNDILNGGGGNDMLNGGNGLNILWGGFGTDTCLTGLKISCE